ncbi:hypothetical protein Sango_0306100 [Sesamum angolense]|uniref:Uncharacterized protein n=1 Tax=Sesamum angolense TaxID=2727404 RepID=A0AAE1X915_9LAMI|nr:hypothetical protein Sango_0306100 [Sesamum angolense]
MDPPYIFPVQPITSGHVESPNSNGGIYSHCRFALPSHNNRLHLQFCRSQPPLDPAEQESVYRILESVNSGIPWRSLFPDDLCSSSPHGVVCEYFSDAAETSDGPGTPHVTELSFGYVSDYSPNPPCDFNSTLDPSLLVPLSHLRKLFFYKCFTQTQVPFPDFSPLSSQNRSASLEELVFVENPGLVGSLDGKISNLRSLRRLVLTGSCVSGGISDEAILSSSQFQETSSKGLKSLEFLDLSYNSFRNFGVPLFLAEMPSLREVYLSGNYLGGQIPEIWGNLGGIKGIGLSGVGLVGDIPKSMGVHLRNLCYLGLDNNRLEGVVPEEFEDLEFVSELNLEKNNLSGRLPFSAAFLSKLGGKLKLEGNSDLCIDEALRSAKISGRLGQLKVCRQPDLPQTALLNVNSCPSLHASSLMAIIPIGLLLLCVCLFLAS